MADAFPTLPSGRLFDLSTELTFNPQIFVSRFGSGFTQRVADGIVNVLRTYNMDLTLLDSTDGDTLATFLDAHLDGSAVTIPLLNVDITGSTTADFFILRYSRNNRGGGLLNNFRIIAEEIV